MYSIVESSANKLYTITQATATQRSTPKSSRSLIVDLDNEWQVKKDNILYKCGWSPFEGTTFKSKVTTTFVNGNPVYENGMFDESSKGQRMLFNR